MLIDLALREGINLGCRGDHVVPLRHISSLVGMAKVAIARSVPLHKLLCRLPRVFLTIVGLLSYFSCELACAIFPIFGIFNCMAIG